MSSPDRVLLRPTARDDGPVTLVSRPTLHVDGAVRARIDEAHAAGVREGVARGRADMAAELATAAEAVAAALARAGDQLATRVAEQHAALAEALGTRVLDAVRAVLDGEPADPHGVVASVVAAVARVEAPALEVRVPPSCHELAAQALADHRDVELVVDDTLGPDDARLLAADVHVDLRRASLLAALDEVLREAAPLGPLGDGGDDA